MDPKLPSATQPLSQRCVPTESLVPARLVTMRVELPIVGTSHVRPRGKTSWCREEKKKLDLTVTGGGAGWEIGARSIGKGTEHTRLLRVCFGAM